MRHTFTATINETEVTVTYTHHKGWCGSIYDPPEPESVEIEAVVPDAPVEFWDELARLAWEDWEGVRDDDV